MFLILAIFLSVKPLLLAKTFENFKFGRTMLKLRENQGALVGKLLPETIKMFGRNFFQN